MVVLDFVLMLTGIDKICAHFPVSFFAFTHHAKTSWKSVWVSSDALSNISEMIRLCCSIYSLLNRNSAAVVMTLMFIDSLVSRNLLLTISTIVSKELLCWPNISVPNSLRWLWLLCLGPLMLWQLLQNVVIKEMK